LYLLYSRTVDLRDFSEAGFLGTMEVPALFLIGDAGYYEDGEELNATAKAMGIVYLVQLSSKWRR